jgi:hypothetical protein
MAFASKRLTGQKNVGFIRKENPIGLLPKSISPINKTENNNTILFMIIYILN